MASYRNILCTSALLASCLVSSFASAGGMALGATRIIYPAGQKQVSLSVHNKSDSTSFLVQSWTEGSDGKKSNDFVVTPPLYVSGPGNENTMRIMYAGQPVKKDRETLYYFDSKSVPSLDKKAMEGKNILLLAAITRIKLFVRPAGLSPSVEDAPSTLTFHKQGNTLRIDNPTPYYITLAKMTYAGQKMPDTMVPPLDSTSLPVSSSASGTVSFHTINDYGALTSVRDVAVS
ncbi:Chaperone protein focC precursor [Serratia grimesii]|uniref:fimbria/pilus periplasmic chaperone n=1 Tax=Serratia grimesii TaxID=82995 RepID=UPI0021C4E823|nr:fimbria/pilus periplasmic chaperone [Serratia grimesii]ULG12738.1 fimbrial chaperone protein [Serratia grimesii]CAI2793940.1 Chaperone protein focC precursor [Serratia grimesii]